MKNIELGEVYCYQYLPDYQMLIVPFAFVTREWGSGIKGKFLQFQYLVCEKNPSNEGTFYEEDIRQMIYSGLYKI